MAQRQKKAKKNEIVDAQEEARASRRASRMARGAQSTERRMRRRARNAILYCGPRFAQARANRIDEMHIHRSVLEQLLHRPGIVRRWERRGWIA